MNVPLPLLRYSLFGCVSLATKTSGQGSSVVVEQRHAQRLRRRVEEARLRGHVLEGAVSLVAEQPRRRAPIRFGRAVGLLLAVDAAVDIGLRRPADVVADEQIEVAVAVVVEPQRRRAEAARCPDRPCR